MFNVNHYSQDLIPFVFTRLESGINLRMSETNVTALKEAISAQQQLLQKLYNELDVERESSATATSEALSMILRLQGEKAAITMEAEQYKRLAEEKMCHAEESMAIFEELMYQKEMEIASLNYQVQSYQYRLGSVGDIDPGTGDLIYPKNLLQINGYLNVETSIPRKNSTPLSLKLLNKTDGERERSESPHLDLTPHEVVESSGEETKDRNLEKQSDNFSGGDINPYWEQIRKLDERVKGLMGGSYPSSSSTTHGGLDQVKRVDDVDTNDLASSSNMHDVFEVPKAEVSLEKSHKNKEKMNQNGDNKKLERMASVPSEGFKDEMDWLKKILIPNNRENNLRRISSGDASVDSNSPIVRPTTGVLESRVRPRKLNRKREIIEVESPSFLRQESSNIREEELKKLNEILAQLKAIQCDIRSLKTNKSSPPLDNSSMLSLQEAMLHFWL